MGILACLSYSGMSEREADALEKQEAAQDLQEVEAGRGDVMKRLEDWCKQELDDVLRELGQYESAEERERRAQEELARIRRQQRRLKKEV